MLCFRPKNAARKAYRTRLSKKWRTICMNCALSLVKEAQSRKRETTKWIIMKEVSPFKPAQVSLVLLKSLSCLETNCQNNHKPRSNMQSRLCHNILLKTIIITQQLLSTVKANSFRHSTIVSLIKRITNLSKHLFSWRTPTKWFSRWHQTIVPPTTAASWRRYHRRLSATITNRYQDLIPFMVISRRCLVFQ